MATIHSRSEGKRGCGYRKEGGIYLVSGTMAKSCGKLPFELTVCKCCGQGIKPTRGFAWIQASLIEDAKCSRSIDECDCPASAEPWSLNHDEQLGLMWVGTSFYPTTRHFSLEAARMGISKRIATVPRGLKIGETWVLLAHRQAVVTEHGDTLPGVFQAFRPDAIEYIVKGDETEEELDKLEKRGFTLIKLEKTDLQRCLI